MKSMNKLRAGLFAFVSLLLIGGASFTYMYPHRIRCLLVQWSDLDNVAPRIYVDPNMPERENQLFLEMVASAKNRIASLYGEYTAAPVIITGRDMQTIRKFGGEHHNRVGRAQITLIGTYIVLGPGGRNTDVIAHELAHAELAARIGAWKLKGIPRWFDEGLALQLDNRYSEEEWRLRTDNGRTAPKLDEIGIIKGTDWLSYATAKHEVRRWLDIVYTEGFLVFMHAIQNGTDFQDAYRSTELTYQEDHQ
jgi:hypothetical protein